MADKPMQRGGRRGNMLPLGILVVALLLGVVLMVQCERQLQQLLPQAQCETVGRLFLWTMAALLGLMCVMFGAVLALWSRAQQRDRRRLQVERDQLHTAATQDPLTGLCNRITFEQRVQQVLDDRREQTHAFLVLDLDDFKGINDSRGHIFGDHVLQEAAQQIRDIFRVNDVVGRLGGDEFVVFMRNVHDRAGALSKVEKLCTLYCTDNRPNGCGRERALCLSVSVGVSFSCPGMEYSELYRRADVALYRAKELGKNGFSVYDASQDARGRDIDGPVHPVV